MRYVDLVREAIRDASVGEADDLQSLATADASQRLAADRVRDAWLRIQTATETWDWVNLPFTFGLNAGQRRYEPREMRAEDGRPSLPTYRDSNVAATRVRRWRRQSPEGDAAFAITDLGADGQGFQYGGLIGYQPYTYFRLRHLLQRDESYSRGEGRGKPQWWTFEPQPPGAILVAPIPDASARYFIHGQAVREAQILRDDDDEPYGILEELQGAIKWRAVMLLLAHDTAADEYQFAQAAYGEVYDDLVRAQRPGMTQTAALG